MRKEILPLLIPALTLFISCSRSKIDLTVDDLRDRFDRGTEFLEKKKYYRAQQDFKYVLLRGRHTELGDDAQFYLGEAYFLNEEYLLAINEYERLIRQMAYSPFAEKGRYRICQSYANKSPKYYHDQEYTQKAIERLQEFIEDYPSSVFTDEAAETIRHLRSKLARKEYEAAILYTKLEEYEPAIAYLHELLDAYYDTQYADIARLKIVESHLKIGEIEKAEGFLDQNETRFKDEQILQDARNLVAGAKDKED